ncbi:MAG: type II toxin-antitoxin system Phd/YefM family antitoxin [Acidobacteriota bacterium]|nr:type II toxin-antitoxin system Phd/YefM family antitoxin [Acidobacteriota bacterium]
MRAVGLKVLKNKLSEYVRLAAGGEAVLITDHDRIVAELVPPSQGRSQTVDDAVLADLVRQGCLTPPLTGTRAASPAPRQPIAPLDAIMNELDQDRADR